MKLFLLFPFTCIIYFSNTISAQNLVPDPGFEIVRRIPTKKNNSVSCTRNWMCPKGDGAADYYHKNAKRHAGVPRNIFGKQKPNSGNAYGGICIRKKFMEYVETKLTDTLIRGRNYLVEFYISRAERSIGSIKECGVLFLNKMSMGISDVGIAVQPSVDFVKRRKYKSKKKWMKFSAVYRAEGDERVLVLGHFNYNKSVRFKGFAHYYIDDVSVTLLQNEGDSVITEKKQDSIPKLFIPKLGEVITFKNVFFAIGKSDLLPGSFQELDQLVRYLNEAPDTYIQINGHTDNTGNEEQNKILSEARAQSVAEYLISKRIDVLRINYTGYGSSKPIAANDAEEGKQQNRRVEFIIKIN